MRKLLTTASLAALIASAGVVSAQTQPAPSERQDQQPQQQQRQQPSGEQRQQPSGQRQPGQAQQQQRGEDHQRGQAQQEQQPGQRRPSQAQEHQQQQRQPSTAQEQQQQQRQPSTAQEHQQQQRQPTQAQDHQQQQRQPSTAQQPGTSQPNQAQQQQPGSQQRQPSTAQQPSGQQPNQAQQQRPQQPSTAQQPSANQQNQAQTGSGEVSAHIASNPQTRTQIEQSVTNIRPASVNVDVRVGTAIPRTVELHPVPQAIIAVAPQYREYRLIRVHDEVVIVNPRTYEVVEVIRTSGGGARMGQAAGPRGGHSLQLTAQQRQLVLRHVREARTSSTTTTQVRVTEGQPLTEHVELETIPQDVITEVPTLREYRYFMSGNEVVIVDPSTNVVTEVIR